METYIRELPDGIQIVPTTYEDISDVRSLINQHSDALVDVSEEEMIGWIEQGMSLVAKDMAGNIIGHQGAVGWEQSGYIEVRSAVVAPLHRGKGINTFMKKRMIAEIRKKHPDVPIIGFTEDASKSRHILKRFGFHILPFSEVPEEFFSICPTSCTKGEHCGCEVYILTDK